MREAHLCHQIRLSYFKQIILHTFEIVWYATTSKAMCGEMTHHSIDNSSSIEFSQVVSMLRSVLLESSHEIIQFSTRRPHCWFKKNWNIMNEQKRSNWKNARKGWGRFEFFLFFCFAWAYSNRRIIAMKKEQEGRKIFHCFSFCLSFFLSSSPWTEQKTN